jgi:hypothetical protein
MWMKINLLQIVSDISNKKRALGPFFIFKLNKFNQSLSQQDNRDSCGQCSKD